MNSVHRTHSPASAGLHCLGLWAPALLILLAVGCHSATPSPDLKLLYNEAAQRQHHLRNPVILIPGVLGTRLQDSGSGRVVWGAFGGDYADPGTPDGARLVALPMDANLRLDQMRDDVVPTGVLDQLRVRIAGLPVQLAAYAYILAAMGVGGYRDQSLGEAGAIDYGDDHFTCFQFGYDWRRDNVENAQRLHRFILEKRAYVRQELARRFGIHNAQVKFDMVAHSMGGLIARYYLRYGDADLADDGGSPPTPTWAGARYVERLIMVGTPNAGAADTFVKLVQGASFSRFFSRYPPAVLGTMPALYQLLPRPRHGLVVGQDSLAVDLYDPKEWIRHGWGLVDPGQQNVLAELLPHVNDAAEQARSARIHLARCLDRARRFHAALDTPAGQPPELSIHLFAGDAVPTPAVVQLSTGPHRIKVVGLRPGDGTVLRSSALMDERLDGRWSLTIRSPLEFDQVHFLFTDHRGLTSDPAFTDNVLFILLEAQRHP